MTDLQHLSGNWNYPTTVRFGVGRIRELPDACTELGMHNPLLVTGLSADLVAIVVAIAGTGKDHGLYRHVTFPERLNQGHVRVEGDAGSGDQQHLRPGQRRHEPSEHHQESISRLIKPLCHMERKSMDHATAVWMPTPARMLRVRSATTPRTVPAMMAPRDSIPGF